MISLRVKTKTETENSKTTTLTDYAPSVNKITVTTQRLDAAGKMQVTLISNKIDIPEGANVYLEVDGVGMFNGYVFKAEKTQANSVTYTCYDQLRYLKAKASYSFKAMSISDIIRAIAKDFKLKVGDLVETGYKFPSLIKDNTSCLDIIFDALAETTRQTGKIFVFYDDLGKLTLKEADSMKWNAVIGDASLLSTYSYSRSIDQNTYNRVKLARPNSKTGKADTYTYQDGDTQKQWGVLQLYKVVNENMNAAQIEQTAQVYLAYYNKIWETLKLSKIIGYTPLRAGWIVPVLLSDIDVTLAGRPKLFLCEKVTHTIQDGAHLMSIEVKNY